LPGDVPEGADRIVLSSAGGAAAFLYDSASKVRIVSGLPADPQVSLVDTSVAAGPVTALALNDDGSAVLLAATEDAGAVLYLARRGSAPQSVGRAGSISAIALLANGADAVFADAAGDRIFLIRGVLERGVPVPLAGDAAGIHRPFAIAGVDDSEVLVA